MSLPVLTAVSDRWEAALVTALERSVEVTVARRCADLADLLATAASGVARVALVSGELRSLDRSALEHLARSGVAVVGVHPPADEAIERHLRQLGVLTVIPADAGASDIEAALDRATRAGDPRHDAPGLVAAGGRGVRDPLAPGADADAGGWGDAAAPLSAPGGPTDRDPAHEEEQRPGQVVAVWGPTGAPGRTTLAVTLTGELAALGRPSLLVDADTYGGCVAQTLALLDEAPGLAAAARSSEHGTLDLPALARLAPEVTRGMRVLTGIPKAERWPELRTSALEHVFSLARHLAAFTVIDCGFNLEDDEELSYDTLAPRRNAATLTALAAADTVVAVGAADPIGLQRLVRGLRELESTGSVPPVVVINKVRAEAVGRRPEQRIRDALTRFAGLDVVRFVPDDRSSLDAALLAGRTLTEHAPQSPARVAVAALAAALAGVPATTPSGRRRGRS